jgi:hypothetical protein
MATGLYQAVTNPVQTVSGLLDVGAGALQKVLPKPVVDFVNQFENNPEAAQRAVNAATAVGGAMKERYGSAESIKNTIATDPVGAMGDLSTLLGGMGGMGRMTASGLRSGGATQLAQGFQKAGDIYAKASDLTNPITLAGKGVSKTADMASALAKLGLGLKTGVGTEPITQAVKAGRGVLNPDGTLTADRIVLTAEEYSSKLVAADEEFTAALPGGAGLVVLDGTVTPDLEAEGWAKDRIRELQDLRKSSGLDVGDRISVVMAVPAGRADWARAHRDLIAGEILATRFEFGEPADGVEIGDGVRVRIVKVGKAVGAG